MTAGGDQGRGTSVGGARTLGRVLLAVLTFYAIAMIAPDFLRLAHPLGSFGVSTNADGLIYDVQGPFESEEESPAWRAGLRAGEHLDLYAMRCVHFKSDVCATNLALWGGVTYVVPGREATIKIFGTSDQPAREVKLIAKQRPDSVGLKLLLLFQQIAGILVVLGAAYLVWIRPGPMTWGFFVYILWFNPGQAFQFYAWLQQWPRALFAQDVVSCVLQPAGYVGLLLFALRVPLDETLGRWRWIERLLPLLGAALVVLSFGSLASTFGFRSELAMRGSIVVGFAVSVAALMILIGRRKDLSPRNYQRIRWVIWGCLIGLPAATLAELSMETSLPVKLFGGVPEEVAGLLFLVNGLLCLFVVEAVRRPTVVSVNVPLRRITVLSLILSVPIFLLHEQAGALEEILHLPSWGWILVASGILFLLSRLHEFATELAERLFDRELLRAEHHLAEVGDVLERAGTFADIEHLLVDAPTRWLRLGSAAVFREQDGGFRRRACEGWKATDAEVLTGVEPMLAARSPTAPFLLELGERDDARNPPLPEGVTRPLLGVQVGNPRRCFALTFYSGHEDGTDLEPRELTLLLELTRKAGHAYAEVESEMLRSRIAVLEVELARAGAPG